MEGIVNVIIQIAPVVLWLLCARVVFKLNIIASIALAAVLYFLAGTAHSYCLALKQKGLASQYYIAVTVMWGVFTVLPLLIFLLKGLKRKS